MPTLSAAVVTLSVLLSVAVLDPPDSGQRQENGKRSRADKAKIIAYAKQLEVARLDRTLPKRPLADWMRESGAPADATQWSVEVGSDMMGANPPLPLCVVFRIVLGDAGIKGTIEVGNERDGITGQPRLREMMFGRRGPKDLDLTHDLSALPRLIARAKQSTR